MKATGVVRRIDNLGRIVIPKEIRKSIKISDGDSLEIYTNLDSIVLKKYSIIELENVFFQKIIDSYYKEYKKDIIITNKSNVVNTTIGLSNYLNKEISNDIKTIMNERKNKIGMGNIFNKETFNYYILPLIIDSDVIGSIILIDNNITDNDINVLNLLKTILIKNIEE